MYCVLHAVVAKVVNRDLRFADDRLEYCIARGSTDIYGVSGKNVLPVQEVTPYFVFA